MNAKQLKAQRRRARQQLKKKQSTPNRPPPRAPSSSSSSSSSSSPLPHSLLNKLVSFDYFTLDAQGFTPMALHGRVVASQDEVLTIELADRGPLARNRRVQALMGSPLLTVPRSALLNLRLIK